MALLHVLDFIPTHFAYASLDASRDLLSRSRSLHPRSLPPRLRDYVTFLQKLHRQIAHGEPPDPCVWKSLDEIKPFSSEGAGGDDTLLTIFSPPSVPPSTSLHISSPPSASTSLHHLLFHLPSPLHNQTAVTSLPTALLRRSVMHALRFSGRGALSSTSRQKLAAIKRAKT